MWSWWWHSAQVLVPGNINNAFLDQLIPDTPYSVNVMALYADGDGSEVKGNGKTCELNFYHHTVNTLTNTYEDSLECMTELFICHVWGLVSHLGLQPEINFYTQFTYLLLFGQSTKPLAFWGFLSPSFIMFWLFKWIASSFIEWQNKFGTTSP